LYFLYINNFEIFLFIVFNATKNIQIQTIANKLNYYEDAFKIDTNFECNIRLKNIENKNKGKYLINFFPICINFIMGCGGNIIFKGKKNLKIEKIKGCLFTQKVMNFQNKKH